MCIISLIDRTCWKELDESIIYYQCDYNSNQSDLRIRNIKANKTMQYFNLVPIRLVLLRKTSSHLYLGIQKEGQILIAALDKNSLNLKVQYNFFVEYRSFTGVILELRKSILLIQGEKMMIQQRRNKLIRKYKGEQGDIMNQEIINKMAIVFYNFYSQEDQIIKSFEHFFEQTCNMSIKQFDRIHGIHEIKKIGDFIILKNCQKHYLYFKATQCPIYFVHIDYILKAEGKHGRIFIDSNEQLKLIKCFNNNLYAVIKSNNKFRVYQINGEYERSLIYSIFSNNLCLKKPILTQDYLILTNKDKKKSVPQEYQIKNIEKGIKQVKEVQKIKVVKDVKRIKGK